MKAPVAEFLGTFILCFVGILGGTFGQPALAHGLVLVGMIPTMAGISGSHFNPAVTLGMLVTKNIKLDAAIGYWVAQMLGGIVAAFAAKSLLSGYGATPPAVMAPTMTQLFLCEALLTMVLVAVVMVLVRRKASAHHAGIAVGFTLAALIYAGGNISGAALNPARGIGPMVASGDFTNLMVYLLAPLVGGAIGALILNWLDAEEAAAA